MPSDLLALELVFVQLLLLVFVVAMIAHRAEIDTALDDLRRTRLQPAI